MLTIRFNRTGKKNRASYRLVLQEKTKAPGKRHVEILGSHDPHIKTTILKKDRILYWLGQGAQASEVVHNLLVREGVIEGKKIPHKMPRPVKKEESAPEEAPAPEAADPEADEPASEEAAVGTPQEEAEIGSQTPEEVDREAEAIPEAAQEEREAEIKEVEEEKKEA
ncbi:MAG: 30S ribosomal protein S16 [Candidatus Moranbacteria bacterium RIFCSPHIGHO2_01_FULL_55_24]|nr:MAG: 30S ribosomal protein S16 [Candidatus Moranbacteria bacterium RIFCSPHIGHO2_01_FULL_55_24]